MQVRWRHWFLGLVPGALEEAVAGGTFKVRTGHVGRMEWTEEGGWRVLSWNRPPEDPLP